MLWSTYLARGVASPSPVLVQNCPPPPPVKAPTAVPDQSRVEKVLKYVEELFRQDGSSPFSSKMAVGYLQLKLTQNPEKMTRVIGYLLGRLNNKQRTIPHPLQSGCPSVLPGLRAQPFWEPSTFPWVATLEAAYPLILQEFLDLKAKGPHFQPYRSPVCNDHSTNTQKENNTTDSGNQDIERDATVTPNAVDGLGQLATDSGDWNVCYLFLHDMECFNRNREACPETIRAIKSIPHQYNHALFSALAPGTHVSEHYGPTNKKLRCHLPLVVPTRSATSSSSTPLCSLTVAHEERALEAGKCVIFDDSFLHEAVNRAEPYEATDPSTGPRVVLIIDIWHPDLSAEEIKFLGFLEKSKMKAVKEYAHSQKQTENDDETDNDSNNNQNGKNNQPNTFFNVIESANGAAVVQDNIWSS